jgi:uncharacterized membrane protein (DUF4010 family)
MLDQLSPIEIAGRLGLAIAMAVFMGFAFEGIYKREQRGSPGGIRTFPLLAILGAMLFLIDPHSLLPYVVGLASVALSLFAWNRVASQTDPSSSSLMIPTANLLAYTFGPLALHQPPWVTVTAAVAAVLLFEAREALHRLVQRVPPEEVFTLGKFLILAAIVLPLVPDHPVVSWTPLSPFKVWMALVAISAISYISYLLQRYLPHSNALLPSILGGVYSSTATTVTLARRQKVAGAARAELTVGIVVATAMMYLRVEAIVALFNVALAAALLPPLATLFIVAMTTAAWQWHRRRPAAPAAVPGSPPPWAGLNPLQMGTAVTFAALFVAVALASSWVRGAFGQRGLYVLAAITGTTDINPFVLSLAQGGVTQLSPNALSTAILIAVASNNLLNASYALAFGGARPCRTPASVLAALGLLGLALAGISAWRS